MKTSGTDQGQSASELISKKIAELGDWRGETLGTMRKLIRQADPDVVEEWKWMGTPVFPASRNRPRRRRPDGLRPRTGPTPGGFYETRAMAAYRFIQAEPSSRVSLIQALYCL